MPDLPLRTDAEIRRLAQELFSLQAADGSWRIGVDNGVVSDAYLVILLRTLNIDDENLIRGLVQRLTDKQEENGAWKRYADDAEGHLSATVEACSALLYSGLIGESDSRIVRAKRYIVSKGGLSRVSGLLTKAMLAVTGHYPWPRLFRIPVELMLLPESLPLNFYSFSSPARVHLAPLMVLTEHRFTIRPDGSPDLSDLLPSRGDSGETGERAPDGRTGSVLEEIKGGLHKLALLPQEARRLGLQRAVQYMLDRIEPDGTLYSYASSTILMIYALLATGYKPDHPILTKAVNGLKSLVQTNDGTPRVQNFTSTVWDTALISHALQEAGTASGHASIRQSAGYLLSRQHTRLGDWSRGIPGAVPGGWGYSDINTMNPDVDDTTAALRALSPSRSGSTPHIRDAVNRGLQWVLSLQNDDGGWPAFERNKDSALLTLLPVEGADAVAVDPSTADLTGRTLQYLGATAGLSLRHPLVQRGVRWLMEHQQSDGSWYGRWGICYLYGTWAALTGMMAVGVEPAHDAVQRAVQFLLSAQQDDGGWGESCMSDQKKTYVSLPAGTPSQTAWALDALIAVYDKPVPAITRGVHALLSALNREDWTTAYPTGAGLPGEFYIRYYSYNRVWPLLALAHYRRKYG